MLSEFLDEPVLSKLNKSYKQFIFIINTIKYINIHKKYTNFFLNFLEIISDKNLLKTCYNLKFH